MKKHPLITLYVFCAFLISIGMGIRFEAIDSFLVPFGSLLAVMTAVLGIKNTIEGNK